MPAGCAARAPPPGGPLGGPRRSTSWTPWPMRIARAAVFALPVACGGYPAIVFAWLHSRPVAGFRDGVMWTRNCEQPRVDNAEHL